MNDFKRARLLGAVLLSLIILSISGCQRVHVPKPGTAGPIMHCFDTVGHQPGTKPWLLGGNCCCTPTAEVLKDWQAHGYFMGKTVDEVIAMYHQAGIKLALDHTGCNNDCEFGPHVVKGGKCMVAPTPGTENYEEVLYGYCYQPQNEAPKAYRKCIPDTNKAYSMASSEKTK